MLFADVSIQRQMKKENIPPEVNLQFMNLAAMDMIQFTDNEMKPNDGSHVQVEFPRVACCAVGFSSENKKSATGDHFVLFGMDPLPNLGNNMETLFSS